MSTVAGNHNCDVARQTASCDRRRNVPLRVIEDNGESKFFDMPRWLPEPQWRGWTVVMPVALLFGCAALFVGADVIERHVFYDMPIGWRHAALTTRSAMVTGFGCLIVFLIMRHQHRRLTSTAERLSGRLEEYRSDRAPRVCFKNRHRVRCWEVKNCQSMSCPAHGATDRPCWQTVALSRGPNGGDAPAVTIQDCHDCEVYKASCPDELAKLGESFNSLMFMLDREAKQVRQMNAQLVEKEKMVAVGQMASGIAHEIGNPLSSISSIIQMIKRRPDPARIPSEVELIRTHVERISGTVRQLSTLARPAPQKWTLEAIGPALDEAVRLISFDRRAKRVKIRFQKNAKNLPTTYILREQLIQVFINLALNALDAMPDGGTLNVGAVRENGSVVVRFKDTGSGIPTDVGRRVFEPFFTTKEAGKGTGLGLSVSYGIVQKHGGEIEFASNQGSGTTFAVRLPVLTEEPG